MNNIIMNTDKIEILNELFLNLKIIETEDTVILLYYFITILFVTKGLMVVVFYFINLKNKKDNKGLGIKKILLKLIKSINKKYYLVIIVGSILSIGLIIAINGIDKNNTAMKPIVSKNICEVYFDMDKKDSNNLGIVLDFNYSKGECILIKDNNENESITLEDINKIVNKYKNLSNEEINTILNIKK